jgi:hypothetical protein
LLGGIELRIQPTLFVVLRQHIKSQLLCQLSYAPREFLLFDSVPHFKRSIGPEQPFSGGAVWMKQTRTQALEITAPLRTIADDCFRTSQPFFPTAKSGTKKSRRGIVHHSLAKNTRAIGIPLPTGSLGTQKYRVF